VKHKSKKPAESRKALAGSPDVSGSKFFDGFVEKLKEVLQAKWSAMTSTPGEQCRYRDPRPCADQRKQFDELMTFNSGSLFPDAEITATHKGWRRIVNLSRVWRAHPAGYALMPREGGIEVLTRYMAKELGARKISVNVVAPGPIENDFAGGVVRDNKEVNKFSRYANYPWARRRCPTISAVQSLPCWRTTITGSPVSESRPPANVPRDGKSASLRERWRIQ